MFSIYDSLNTITVKLNKKLMMVKKDLAKTPCKLFYYVYK